MLPRLLLLFITVPLIELYLLVKVGEEVGAGPTIALVILTGILGAALARSQGRSILQNLQTDLQAGRSPTNELLDGFLVLVGGIVLLTPGLLTDLFGFALLIPALRTPIRKRLQSGLASRFVTQFPRQPQQRKPRDENVIDV